MASIRKSYQKSSVKERISQLYQKINTLEPRHHEAKKKFEVIDSMCDDLEEELQQFTLFADEKLVDIKHKANKIGKEVKKNYVALDAAVRDQIRNCSQRMMGLLEQQSQITQDNNLRMLQYVEQETSHIHLQIQKEAMTREEEGRLIEESLSADIEQIVRALDEVSAESGGQLKKMESELYSKTEGISGKLSEICCSYSENEGEYYKMLRDLVKKVKAELHEHQCKREETEAEILNLIDRMCDNSLEKKHS